MTLTVTAINENYKGVGKMESYEAMRQLVGGDSVAMAKRLGRSSSLIQKWCEPNTDFTDSGAYNPLDRISGMMDEAELLGKSSLEVLAPVRHLATNRALVIPITKKQSQAEEINQQTAIAMKEFGEAIAVAAAALQDQKLSPYERKEVLKEMDEALHALLTLEGMFRG